METPLLATKLFIPEAQPGLVPRSRLIERLQDALCHSLALVSAPAGFGKTTVVTQWIAAQRPPGGVAWVSLDEGDNDPVRFWDYFVAAVRTLIPEAGGTASTMLHSPGSYATQAVLTALINDLATISDDLVVVLDDYHLITAEAVHTGVAFLVDRMPPRMHLVIATRTDPPLPLARFRGRGMFLEIRTDDLRFTLEEATGLLQKMLGPALSSTEVQALNEHTEGWAVGLKMAALSLRGQRDVAAFIESFTGSQRYVMDYLVEEVLRRQPDEVRDFLLKTSVLEKLSAPLCDSLTGRRGSQDVLVKLEQSNLFVVPLDASRQWYRYHHLFAELLRHQLKMASSEGEIRRLHVQASQWCEDNGLFDDAIHHALAARDWDMAVRLICAQGAKRHKRGENATVLDSVRALPDDVTRKHPGLLALYSRALLATGDLIAAESVLVPLEQAGHDDANVQGEIAGLRALIAIGRGEYARAMELATLAKSLLAADNPERARMTQMQGFVLFEKGLYTEAEPLLTEGYDGARRFEFYDVAASALNFLAVITSKRGRLHQAVSQLREAVRLAGFSPASIAPRLSLSSALYEMNQLDEAAYEQQKVNELSQPRGNAQAYFFLAHTRLSQGDVDAAVAAAEKSDTIAQERMTVRYGQARHAAYRVMLAIRLGDLAATEYWHAQLLEHADFLPFWLAHVPFRALIAAGEKVAAAAKMRAFCQQHANSDARGILLKIHVCQAMSAATADEAINFLSEALETGQAEGYVRTFVDEGRLLKPLLRTALARGVTPDYTRKLLDIIEKEERRRQAGSAVVATPAPSGVLSERELEILRLVESGLSNRQIADRLIISLGTAKTHVHNVFEKLDVKTRTQAISRARELKLI